MEVREMKNVDERERKRGRELRNAAVFERAFPPGGGMKRLVLHHRSVLSFMFNSTLLTMVIFFPVLYGEEAMC